MEHRRTDSENIVVRRSGNSLTITGISAALVIALVSLIFNIGSAREKISRLESGYNSISVKLDVVSGKVDNLTGRMDMLLERIGR